MHALVTGMADYADGLLHGECVAIGMVLESYLARCVYTQCVCMYAHIIHPALCLNT